jgi:murein tripeptide amidase MpaA
MRRQKWLAGFAVLLIQFNLLALFTVFSQGLAPAPVAGDTNLIVRLYYGERSRLDQLAGQYDVFEFADHDAGYVAARLSRSEYDELLRSGYRVEIDPEQTALANRALGEAAGQFAGIPSFPCYRTVEETYATLAQIAREHPELASLVDIGDSWDKVMSGGAAGYDLLALVLSNKSRPGPKPRFLLVAEFHARELTTAETATRFAEELVSGYGVDPDVTWMLDYIEVHIIPMANPDGRKLAEQGQLWRKNTDSDDGCGSGYGTDMNRNCSFKWGLPGASASPCDETYRGPASFSEPENQAVRDYILSLFPDQRGPADTDAAPGDTTGLVVSLHSYAQLVLYPWGWTATAAPNSAALQTLGGRFGYFNRYTVEPGINLYAVSGELTDWVYGELGVPAYTFEMGTTFFQACATFQNTIYPSNRPALFYACKACRRPYLSPAGPDVMPATVSTISNAPSAWINLSAIAVSGRSSGYTPLPSAAAITAARYSVDNPSWVAGVETHSMSATDGSFNSSTEAIVSAIDTTGWSPGRHTLFIEARTGTGNWGVPTAAFAFVQPPAIVALVESNHIVLRWPGTTNTLYTVLQSSNLLSPFSVLASNLVAVSPTNTYIDAVSTTGSRFYRLKLQP